MELSRKSIEALLDLVEIKLSCIQVHDREDAREVKTLERCRQELCAVAGIKPTDNVVQMPVAEPAPRAARVI